MTRKIFSVLVVATKDRTGYIARWRKYSFWHQTRMGAINAMLERITEDLHIK